jgi:diguanylate cyclase (GGDEF)-like protein
VFYEELFSSLSLYVVSIIVGYLRMVKRRSQKEIEERIRVAHDFEAQVAALRNLANVTNELLDADDVDSMLSRLAEQTRNIFNAQDCLISLWDLNSRTYYPRVAVGQGKKALENTPAYPENDELILLQSADILVYGSLHELSETWRAFSAIYPKGALLALPLGASGQKVGILQLFYEHAHDFTPNELAYAKLTSRQISQAIWKVILLMHAEEQVEELRVLHEVGLILPTVNDEATLLKETVDVLGATLYPQSLVILLIDSARNVLEHRANYELKDSEPSERLKAGQGIIGRVARTGKLERYDDVRKAPKYLAALQETRSEICVPLKMRNKVLGIINVESRHYAAFNERDERILTTVANQVAVALTRLRAEQAQVERVLEIARSNDLIHGLTVVASEMEMSSDPNAVMQQMGMALDRKGLKALIALFEPGSQDLIIRYTSLEPNVVRKLERVSRVSMQDFRIKQDSLPAYINLNENLHPVIVDDYISAIKRVLQGYTNDMLRRIFDSTLDPSSITLGHFPLVYHEKVLGFLWLWGESLREGDLPTLSVFANQVAASLENARLFADVQRLAITDGLTNLSTRRHFFELAYEEFYRARRYGHPLCVVMLDLDHFKKINDTYGHAVGDLVLEKAAATCRQTLRTNDIVGRYGGEEIVIVLVETDLKSGYQVALRIADNVRKMVVPTKKGKVKVTISGGVSGDNVEARNLIDMIEAADQALYVAKANGRDRIEVAPHVQTFSVG